MSLCNLTDVSSWSGQPIQAQSAPDALATVGTGNAGRAAHVDGICIQSAEGNCIAQPNRDGMAFAPIGQSKE